eukprot:1173010-Alexandrium_andersonii.AAC.1
MRCQARVRDAASGSCWPVGRKLCRIHSSPPPGRTSSRAASRAFGGRSSPRHAMPRRGTAMRHG